MAEETAATSETAAAETTTETAAVEKMHSQADLDRIVQDRLAREKAKYADYDDLKTKATEFDKIQEASRTEAEKTATRMAELERAKTDAETRAQDILLRSSIISEAAGKLADPSDAVALIDRASIEFDDTGAPKNVAALVTGLLEAKPHLAAGKANPGNADLGARTGNASQITREQLAQMSPEEVTKALTEGKFAALLSGKQ